MTTKIFACIGARATPPNILAEMTKIGKAIANKKDWIRSGHAQGADWAFEQGAQEQCLVYLPYVGFNNRFTSRARSVCITDTVKAQELVQQLHPAGSKFIDQQYSVPVEISPGVMELHSFMPGRPSLFVNNGYYDNASNNPIYPQAYQTQLSGRITSVQMQYLARNCFQVLGKTLKDPVSAVICWTEKGEIIGGTAMAIRVAIANKIPVINMFNEHSNTASKVLDIIYPENQVYDIY